MKKLFFILCIIIIIFFLYIKYSKQDNLIMSFGSSFKSDYFYDLNNKRLKDVIYDINDNIIINDKHIQNILIKSKTIYIDISDVYNINNDYNTLVEFLDIIRKYNKNTIILYVDKSIKYEDNQIFKFINNYDIIVKR